MTGGFAPSATLRACLAVAVARLALRAVAFADLPALIDAVAPRVPRVPASRAPSTTAGIASAVERASRLLPGTTSCLAKAVAARMLLAQRGLVADILIGVMRGPGGTLDAHAWVESEGRVVLGATDAPYARFPRSIW